MNNSEIIIFYSWQSDLSGSETRNLIQDSIKDAVKLLRDTVDIEADRDTKGEFGTPDIAQTIFSKIDDCDIFIADVTAVCKLEMTDKDGKVKTKLIPNPNVMLELGYATQVIGWENVICVLNTDYGSPEDMPFDIANRRLTPYSLKGGKSKGEIKRYLRNIIQDTVENILQNGKRIKSGFSYLKVGSFISGYVSSELNPFEISKSTSFIEQKNKVIAECAELLKVIRNINVIETSCDLQEQKGDNALEAEPIVAKDGTILTPVKSILSLDLFKSHKVYIKDEDKEAIIELCLKYIGEDLSDDKNFFNIGNLKVKHEFGISPSSEYEGTEEEKNKYDRILTLEYKLHQLSMWDRYITTFNGLIYVPLAIENESLVYDEDIDIYVSIRSEEVMPIIPSKELINPNMKGLEGIIVEENIIKELLLMFESSEITYDEDITYTLADTQAAIKAQFSASGINGNPIYDEDDYEREISKYIAAPIENSMSEFVFSIKSLKAKEKKWLGPALLLKPLVESFEITYSIKSKHSNGDLNGSIRYTKTKDIKAN